MASGVPRVIGDNPETRRFLDKLDRAVLGLQNPAVTPVAPLDASYVTLGVDATLANERVLTAGAGISLTDGGAGAAATLAVAAGAVLQCLQTTYATNASLSTTIPIDDTTPTSTEGTQVLSQAITPASSGNKVLVIVHVWGSTQTANAGLVAALFRGSTCIQVANNVAAASFTCCVSLAFLDLPASASSQTYSVRVGAGSGNVFLNGTVTGRQFGGTATSTLTLIEIKV